MADPLRIAVLVDQFPELSETFVVSEVRELTRQGHAVRVEANMHARNRVPVEDIDVAFIADDSVVARVWSAVRLVARFPLRCLRDVKLKKQLGKEEPVRTLRELAPVAWRLRAFGASHLHAHFARGAAADALRLGALLGVPYSVMTHGYDIFQLPQSLRLKHERAAFAVSACDYSVRYLEREFGARASRLVTGVDPDVFSRRTSYDPPGSVVAVGRLVEKKGFGVLVEAAASVPGLSRVTIVGDGPLRSPLESRVRELGLESVVSLVGQQPPERVRALLEDAALLAAPCVVAPDGDRDTMPVVVKEALAMEVPVVASDEVGLPEVVRPEWGRLVPPGDADALSAAISELLALPAEERREMGRAGRAFVLEECNLTCETERLVALIRCSTPA